MKMKIAPIHLTCKCGHVFNGEIVIKAPISVMLASMKAIRCPKCGDSEYLLIGREPEMTC